MSTPPVIGIVGGIGAGKSMVAEILAALGCVVANADKHGHEVLEEPDVLKQALLEDAEDYFPRRYSVPLFDILKLNKGIVYEQGARHRRQKRLCIPSFEQSKSMSSFLVAVQDETDVLASGWQARLDAQASALAANTYRRVAGCVGV